MAKKHFPKGSVVTGTIEVVFDDPALYEFVKASGVRISGDDLTPFTKFTPEEARDFCNAAMDGKVQERSGFRMITEPDPED